MIPLTIILQSCIGSVSVMLIFMNQNKYTSLIELTTVVIVCMGYNAAILAQIATNKIFNFLLITLSLNSLIILYNIIKLV